MLPGRFELPTSPLPRECSTPELRQPFTMKVSSGYRRFCKDKLDVLVWVMYGKIYGQVARNQGVRDDSQGKESRGANSAIAQAIA